MQFMHDGTRWHIRIGNWEPRTPWEKAVAICIGCVFATIGVLIALAAVFGIALPAVAVGLGIAAVAVVIALAVGLGAILLPVAIILAPVALIVWGIIALVR